MNIKNKYNILYRILYLKKDNQLKELVYFYFYKSILYNYKNLNYKFIFRKDFYNLIKKYEFFGIYDCEFILYYNQDSTYQIDFIKKNIFNKNKLNKLKNFSKKYTDNFFEFI
jgi:hypothetical protein